MKKLSEGNYPKWSLLIALISVMVLACSANVLAVKNFTEDEVLRLARVVSSVTNLRFANIPQVEMKNSASVKETLRSDERFFQGILQKKGYNNFELRTTEDVDLLGRYSYFSRKIYLSEDLLQKYADLARLDVEIMKNLVVIHELIHAQDDELYGLRNLINKASNAENWFAISSVIEGHAYQLAARVYEKEGISKKDVEQYMENIQKPRYLNAYWPMYAKGMDFWAYLQKNSQLTAKDVFAKPPLYGEQVLKPREYLAGEYLPPLNLEKSFVTFDDTLPWFFKTTQLVKIDPLTFLVNSYVENGKNDLVDQFKGGLMFRFYERLDKKPQGQQSYANPLSDGKKGVLAVDIYETGSVEDARGVYEYCKSRTDYLNGKNSEVEFADLKKRYPGLYINLKHYDDIGESGSCVVMLKTKYVVQISESNLNMGEKDLLQILEQIEKRLTIF